jgi:hypothetical protein
MCFLSKVKRTFVVNKAVLVFYYFCAGCSSGSDGWGYQSNWWTSLSTLNVGMVQVGLNSAGQRLLWGRIRLYAVLIQAGYKQLNIVNVPQYWNLQ